MSIIIESMLSRFMKKNETNKLDKDTIEFYEDEYKEAIDFRKSGFNIKGLKHRDLPSTDMILLGKYTEQDILKIIQAVKKNKFHLNDWSVYMVDDNYNEYSKEIDMMKNNMLFPIQEDGSGNNIFYSLRNKSLYYWDHEESPQIKMTPTWMKYSDFLKEELSGRENDKEFKLVYERT